MLGGARAAVVADQQSGVSATAQRWIKSRCALHEDAVGDVSAGADGDIRRGEGQLREESVADWGFRSQRENAVAGDRGKGLAAWLFGAAAKTGGSRPQGHRRLCDYAGSDGAASDSSGGDGVAGANGSACGWAACGDDGR